jgi:hypothetical protein
LTQPVAEESTEPSSEIPSQSPKEEVKSKKKKKKSLKGDDQAQQIPAPETSQAIPTSDQKVPPYLQYLQLYHHDRSNWKFQSIQQKQLLKNTFNLYRIPGEYTPALANYISGLKSLGSRILLAKQADEILQQFHNAHSNEPLKLTMESLGARKAAYENALRRAEEEHRARGGINSEYEDLQILEMINERIRAERAEAILFEALKAELDGKLIGAICVEPVSEGDVAAAEQQVNGEDQSKGKRKRKARTHVSDDESSSSSSSSSSGSSSESESDSDDDTSDDDDKKNTTPSKKKVKKTKPEPIFGAALLNRVFGKKDAPRDQKATASSSSDASTSEDESTSDESSSASDSDDETSTSSASTDDDSSDESL